MLENVLEKYNTMLIQETRNVFLVQSFVKYKMSDVTDYGTYNRW